MGRRHWSRARSLVSLLLAMALGCASLQPSLGATCRGSDGRFTTCPSSGSGVSDEVLIGLGVAAGVALIGTVVYAVARSGSADAGVAAPPEPPGAITPPAQPRVVALPTYVPDGSPRAATPADLAPAAPAPPPVSAPTAPPPPPAPDPDAWLAQYRQPTGIAPAQGYRRSRYRAPRVRAPRYRAPPGGGSYVRGHYRRGHWVRPHYRRPRRR